jgi:hypothetical protein
LTYVYLGCATGAWTSKPRWPAPRRGAALLAVFAILLQAVLIGWHHHPFPFGSWGTPTVLAVGSPSGHSTPALTDNDCQICFALSHHSAAPVHVVPDPLPGPARLQLSAVKTVWVPLRSYVLFRSRAPPRV